MTSEPIPNADLYAGFYQGLAWAEGATNLPIICNIPNELMRPVPNDDDEPFIDFNLTDFFRTVADLDDEGYIHYWDIHLGANDKPVAMTLYCTESDYRTSPGFPDSARHSSTWVMLAAITALSSSPTPTPATQETS